MRVRTCEICGKRVSRYVCQECGREVCQFCLEPNTWVCLDCYHSLKQETPVLEVFPWSTPFKLFLLSFLLILIGTIFTLIASVLPGTFSIGAIIFLGPIPIILGAGPHLIWVIILAFALTILGIVAFITLRKRAG